MPIRIANKKTLQLKGGETAVYCGRGKAPAGMEAANLGNPFVVGPQYQQGEAAAAYLPYLQRRVREGGPERATILTLARRLNAGEALVLVCWCFPQACHALHVLAAVQGYAAKLAAQEVPHARRHPS